MTRTIEQAGIPIAEITSAGGGIIEMRAEGETLPGYYLSLDDYCARRELEDGFACVDLERLYSDPDEYAVFYLFKGEVADEVRARFA